MTTRNRRALAISLAATILVSAALVPWSRWVETRVAVIAPGLVRGAWQGPRPLRRILDRERIKTVVTLTAINPEDPKYVAQAPVLARAGVDWVFVPMRGSRATLDQMAEAADLLNDPRRRPVFFHCVAGHHRTSLAHAAYLIRHRGSSAEAAWAEVAAFPWSRPGARGDVQDRTLIFAFAARESQARASVLPGAEPCQLSQLPASRSRR